MALVPMATDHIDGLTAVGLDPELWRWSLSVPQSRADIAAYVDAALRDRQSGDAWPFVTVERATDRIVGSTRFGALCPEHRRVEIGWTWIAKPWQRTVINTEAKYLMLRHAFESLGCIRVELKTDARNEQSRTAIARLGAKEEGTLRAHMIADDGRVRDTVYYSLLADDWPVAQERLAARLAQC